MAESPKCRNLNLKLQAGQDRACEQRRRPRPGGPAPMEPDAARRRYDPIGRRTHDRSKQHGKPRSRARARPDERPASSGKRWAILIGFAALVSIAAASINHRGDQRTSRRRPRPRRHPRRAAPTRCCRRAPRRRSRAGSRFSLFRSGGVAGHQGVYARLRRACPARGRRALRAPLLRERHDLAAALDRRPGLVEIRDQPLHVLRPRAVIERRAVGELVGRLMHRRIALAPEPPRLLRAEASSRRPAGAPRHTICRTPRAGRGRGRWLGR